jgi:hypothetical protein
MIFFTVFHKLELFPNGLTLRKYSIDLKIYGPKDRFYANCITSAYTKMRKIYL